MRAYADFASLQPYHCNLAQRHDNAVALQQAASCKQGAGGVK